MKKRNKIRDVAQQLDRWREYTTELFEDEKSESDIDARSGLPITKSEVEQAIKLAKNGKATGPDQLSTDILKLLGNNAITAITNYCILPSDWLKTTFVMIPKNY